ncbi:MAG TPA: hypothetical protein VL128_05170 [Candidatus Eisenbacteria bacterium]|nr:hypothetical protein [Candidatus Eisenbacteria bacterium]
MQCKDLELVVESEGLVLLTSEAREHLTLCPACRGFVSDLEFIAAAARAIPAEIEPPAHVWTSLRAQLEAEGLIKEPVTALEGVPSRIWPRWFGLRSLITATAGAALLAAVLLLTHTPVAPRAPAAGTPAQAPVQTNDSAPSPLAAPPAAPAPSLAALSVPKAAFSAKRHSSGPTASRIKELAPSPSEDAGTTFAPSPVDQDFPDMELAGNSQVDASLRQNLRTLNEFIAECERHLKENPHDQLAREYLYTAYQQKADLLATMMDSARSEH